MIGDQAVEAALDAYLEHRATRGPGNALNMMRAALEAAAPHMLAEAQADAWDKAWANARGNYAALYTQRPIPEWVTLTNPYRSQA